MKRFGNVNVKRVACETVCQSARSQQRRRRLRSGPAVSLTIANAMQHGRALSRGSLAAAAARSHAALRNAANRNATALAPSANFVRL